MLIGTYERAGVPWSPRQTPWDFAQTCCRTTSSASRPSLEVGFRALSRRSAQRRHPQGGQRPVHLRARRQSAGGTGAGPARISGSRAPSWPASARAAASGWRCRSGWWRAIRERTSGPWTWRATATGRRSATPTPRCARTTRGASASAFRTRSCRPRGRCAPRRSTSGSRPQQAPCWATTAGSSTPLWFAPSRGRAHEDGHLPPLERASRTSARECPAVREAVGSARDLQLRQVRGHAAPAPRQWLSRHHGEPDAAATAASRSRRC